MYRLKRIKDYTLDDPEFNVVITKTHSGCWKNPATLHKLIEAFRLGKNLKESWKHAGITKKKWRDLIKHHPEFDKCRRECQSRAKWVGYVLNCIDVPNQPKAKEVEIEAKSLIFGRYLVTFEDGCWNCNQPMKILMSHFAFDGLHIENLNNLEIQAAKREGVNIRYVSNNVKRLYHLANVCKQCNAPIDGESMLNDYHIRNYVERGTYENFSIYSHFPLMGQT